MTRRTAVIALAAVALAAALGVVAWRLQAPGGEDALDRCRTTALATGGQKIGGPFTLIDETGATVTEREVIDGLALIYFGYTYCPDVCPMDAARNAEAVERLAEQGIRVKPVFITIDPDRDTPEVLAAFTDLLHPDMLGLTGSPEALKRVRDAYMVYAARRGQGEDYLMDHTSYSYLMHPEAGLLDIYRHDTTAEEIVTGVACFARALGGA
ncbi:MAG: protein senC [Paracoccaceae bacterium]|nr:MAG: protein senC [Paracoccaceae bacterium]